MKFHLNFEPVASADKITHQQLILSVGSCFSNNIVNKLQEHKITALANPFGIIFDPLSIANILNRIAELRYFNESNIFESSNGWVCYEAHSSLFSPTRGELLTFLNRIIDEWHAALKRAHWLFITPGSAYHYIHCATQYSVANCHKLPGSSFTKKLVDTSTIVNSFNITITKLKLLNPELKFVFTVSPVKHLRDGVVENNLSKSILLQSVHNIVSETINCHYFPVYELVTDDLRDYRFYEADMAHPNKEAVNYVWEKFSSVYFDEKTINLNKKLYDLNNAINHTPINKNSEGFVKFKKAQFNICIELKRSFAFLNLENEIKYFGE